MCLALPFTAVHCGLLVVVTLSMAVVEKGFAA
jgi:hypothetical protein